MMTTQELCSAAKLNFPEEFGLDSNESRGAWSNHASCVHFSLAVIARKRGDVYRAASSLLPTLFFPFHFPLQR